MLGFDVIIVILEPSFVPSEVLRTKTFERMDIVRFAPYGVKSFGR
jgi:hypothetical protein